jgi:hypothetical protein
VEPEGRTTIQVRAGTGTLLATWVLPEGSRPDLAGVDALARLQLAARRLGWSIRLCTVCPRLGEVVDLAGLADVLGLGVEAGREPEDGEELGPEEVVVPGDPAP